MTINMNNYRNTGGRSYCYNGNHERWPRKNTLMHECRKALLIWR